MENRNYTIEEMQQQLHTLKEKLESQTIVNDKLLRRAYRKSLNGLKKQEYTLMFLNIFAMLLWFVYFKLADVELSTVFMIITEGMLATFLVRSLLMYRQLPSMNTNMISAAVGVSKFRKNMITWHRIGMVVVIFWLGWLIYELSGNSRFISLVVGAAVGAVIGFILGLIKYRSMLNNAEELLSQIEDLKKDNNYAEAIPYSVCCIVWGCPKVLWRILRINKIAEIKHKISVKQLRALPMQLAAKCRALSCLFLRCTVKKLSLQNDFTRSNKEICLSVNTLLLLRC